MDIAAYLQRFESSMSTFVGDDPLEQWDKFVELLLRKLPPDSTSQLSFVFNRLVETFLNVEKYANDERYVNYCIKCASLYAADPIALYSHLFGKGVGTHSAALYVSWAQQLEQRGMNDQAEAVYQKGLENQAQPTDNVLREYRQFQSRTKRHIAPSAGARNPLQNSNSANIMTTRGEPSIQNKESVDCQPAKSAERRCVVMVSRSEYSGKLPPSSNENLVAAYDKEALQCEGSELCFEEVRAQRYFQKIQEQQQRQQQQQEEAKRQETIVIDEDVTQAFLTNLMDAKMILKGLDEDLELRAPLGRVPESHQPVVHPQPSVCLDNRPTLGRRLQSEPDFLNGTRMPPELLDSRASVTTQSLFAPVSTANVSQDAPVSVPGMSLNVPAVDLAAHAPVPSVSMPYHAPAAPIAHHTPNLTASMSHHTPVPAASMSYYAPVPAASMSYHAPVPAASMSHQAPVPAASMSHQAPVPAASMSYHAPVPAASMSYHAPVPAASMSFHAPVPAASMSHHAPVPAASMSYHAPVPAASMSHHAPVPAASMSHHEPLLPQGLSSDNCPPENNHKHNEEPLEPEHEANVSQGGTANLSHITPNNSLGYIQATPSRVLPSPTVNTREALDVIMDMFQAPTLLEDPFSSALGERDYDVIYTRNGPSVKPAAAAPFTIFQDDAESEDKENGSAPSAVCDKVNPIRALAELPKPTKANDTPTELAPDESTMWGAQFHAQNSMAACPNSTSDFAMLARLASTPFTHKTPMSTANSFFPDQENSEGVDEEGFARRYTKKLSPIMEQSPSEEKLNDTAVTRQGPGSQQGTIVGEALAMTNSCTTMVQPPPPAVLSFRDQTLGPNNTSVQRSTGPGWEIYTSPEPSPKREAFSVMEDMEEPQPIPEPRPPQDVPMSPESAPRPDWLTIHSPEKSAERDLDAFLTPHRPEAPRVTHLSQDVPMSPQVEFSTDAHMMSPDRDMRAPLDVSMNPKTPGRSRAGPVTPLVPDPWNDDLIAHLLGGMDPPLTGHPHCVTWQCNIPNIAPKMTLSMGHSSLRVDCVLGEGAFAKVYQATDPMTSDKMVLKVQKPANPWEFYINTQLDARVPPSVRHFYSSFRSVHLFNNGSVLLGDMHNYGTLLNAVNMYRTLGDKVMPQPLVLYFTVCILHMIEELHRVGIVHADVKPDNFLLGERFLENTGFDMENLDHGLVLIDLGQSIDMRLFPEGTAFTAKCLTSGFQCTEMQTGKPWNYQTDYFGVAGTVYCMLFGTYMQVVNDGGVWRTNGVFRRNPHSDLWQEFFHTLLNVPDCSSRPDLRGLRHKLLSVLEQNYRSKLPALKSRLVVLLLESSRKASRR